MGCGNSRVAFVPGVGYASTLLNAAPELRPIALKLELEIREPAMPVDDLHDFFMEMVEDVREPYDTPGCLSFEAFMKVRPLSRLAAQIHLHMSVGSVSASGTPHRYNPSYSNNLTSMPLARLVSSLRLAAWTHPVAVQTSRSFSGVRGTSACCKAMIAWSGATRPIVQEQS